MKSTNRAVLYPKDRSRSNPIEINWNGLDVIKPTRFFRKVCINALNQSPPLLYKQIVFFYIDNELKYLKPFSII